MLGDPSYIPLEPEGQHQAKGIARAESPLDMVTFGERILKLSSRGLSS